MVRAARAPGRSFLGVDDAGGRGDPAGSGVGELGTSVRLPPLTAKTETICMPEPLTATITGVIPPEGTG